MNHITFQGVKKATEVKKPEDQHEGCEEFYICRGATTSSAGECGVNSHNAGTTGQLGAARINCDEEERSQLVVTLWISRKCLIFLLYSRIDFVALLSIFSSLLWVSSSTMGYICFFQIRDFIENQWDYKDETYRRFGKIFLSWFDLSTFFFQQPTSIKFKMQLLSTPLTILPKQDYQYLEEMSLSSLELEQRPPPCPPCHITVVTMQEYLRSPE